MLDWAARMTRREKRAGPARPQPLDRQGGLVAGTLVATDDGWHPVEKLSVGDKVMTFDDGVQEVVGVTRSLLPIATGVRPLVAIPADTIGNRRPMFVPDGQPVLVESDLAETWLGDAFAALEASELLGLPGVRRVMPEEPVTVVTLTFAEDQMVFIEGHALAYCPAAHIRNPQSIEEAIWPEDWLRYTVLSHEVAEVLVADMVSDANGLAASAEYVRPTEMA